LSASPTLSSIASPFSLASSGFIFLTLIGASVTFFSAVR
jgi:hypothetical protein